MVVAEDEASLREVMERIAGKAGIRAMPDSLPEWKHVDRTVRFWAVHHVRPDHPEMWLGEKGKPGAEGAGVTFAFKPTTKLATVTYLMSDDAMPHVRTE